MERLGPTMRHGSKARWIVHLGLIAAAATSLVFEPVLSLHIVLGVGFVALVIVHLSQRRRVSVLLVKRLQRPRDLKQPAGRLALSDAVLMALTIAMFASGLWDWIIGHPTRIRWHAITGVLLAIYLLVHTLRRWRRLRSSMVR
jgi:hypothetical protein